MIRAALALGLAAVPAMACAQSYACAVPERLTAPRPDLPDAGQPRRVVPIGGYTLAITWSPQQCRTAGRDDRFRCAGGGGRFGFTLHGLWPDGEGRQWPQYCTATGIVPERTVRQTLCATPSVQLIQHQWAKHGTCMPGETPDRYFARARALYGRIRYPDMAALSRRPGLTVGQFSRAFAAANPGLAPAMFRVTRTRDGWLDEIWLCRDTALRPARCPAHQGGAAPADPLRIWRGRRS